MRALYLESTYNKKQERLCDVVSHWLNCRILSNLSMVLGNYDGQGQCQEIAFGYDHEDSFSSIKEDLYSWAYSVGWVVEYTGDWFYWIANGTRV